MLSCHREVFDYVGGVSGKGENGKRKAETESGRLKTKTGNGRQKHSYSHECPSVKLPLKMKVCLVKKSFS